jgi:AcrR family transcriptional regulator
MLANMASAASVALPASARPVPPATPNSVSTSGTLAARPAAASARQSGEERVRRSTDAFFSFVEHHRYAWRMLFRDPPADEQIAAVHTRIYQQGTAAIARLIHQAPALRLPPGIPRGQADEMLARAIKSGNDGLAAWWYEHREVPKDQVVDVAVALCWRGLARLTGALPEP